MAEKHAIIRPKSAAAYIGMAVSSIYRIEKQDPTFPRRIKLSKRASGWRKSDLDQWLEQKAKEGASA